MVKAKDFWNYLCDELNYRFFSGVACPGLLPLYKEMNPDIMHYVPAANERIALGMVSGAAISGFKGGILIDMRFRYDFSSLFKFNINYKIPLLIIGYGDAEDKLMYDFPDTLLGSDYKKSLKKITSKLESKLVPGLIVIGEGDLQ